MFVLPALDLVKLRELSKLFKNHRDAVVLFISFDQLPRTPLHIHITARSRYNQQSPYLNASPAGKQQIGKQKTSRNQKDSYTSSSYDIHKQHSHSKPKQCISPDSFHFSHQKKHILFIIYASFVKIPYHSIIFLYCLRHQLHRQYRQK